MPKKLGSALWTFGLLVLAVISWQWTADQQTSTETTEKTIEMAANETDYYLQDFHIVRIQGESGKVFELRGDTLSHYITTGHSTIERPRVEVKARDAAYWRGDANTGILSADFNSLKLNGGVELEHRSGIKAQPVIVLTDEITINTLKRTLDTSEVVTVTAPGWSFNATGMTADTNAGTLSFHNKVEATYGAN